MMLGGTPFFQNNNPRGFEMYEGVENSTLSSSACPTSGVGIHSQTLWYNLSLLREKVHKVQTLVSLVFSPDPIRHESIASASSGAAAIIQEIIVAASSMMYALQQAAVGDISNPHDTKASYEGSAQPKGPDHVLNDSEGGRMSIFGAATHHNTYSVTPIASAEVDNGHSNKDDSKKPGFPSSNVIELDAADLLAKYSHYCQVCGKGFKRDANLRMHMRAHGDEYKTNAALCNPMKGSRGSTMGQKDDPPSGLPRKYYSCPQEGCRWNKNHARFQPLKSVTCVKNHYKRSHCPKMYACKRCNQKKFSVLSDLRTHEKHCGDLRWMCSCGTTFSRKDKLMGHVALFVGHAPV